MRAPETLLLEATLMARTGEAVYEWLKEQASQPKAEGTHDVELEAALLTRSERLVQLGLGLYGRHSETLRTLFLRAREQDDLPMRLAVLSNTCATSFMWNIPMMLYREGFAEAEQEGEFMGQLRPEEVSALFANPTIDDTFLTAFLERKESWEALDEARQWTAVNSLGSNPRMWADYDGPMDGYAEYSFDKVFDLAWQLAEHVPTTAAWAHALSTLYAKLKPQAFSIKQPLKLLERWQLDPAKEEDKAYTMTGWAYVRKEIGRLALASGKRDRELAEHPDPAVRAAAYAYGSLDAATLEAAAARDPGIALESMLYNERLWRRPDTRQVLHDLAWADNPRHDLFDAGLFRDMEDKMEAAHPEWFSDPAPDDEGAETPPPLPPLASGKTEENPWPSRLLWLAIGAAVAGTLLR